MADAEPAASADEDELILDASEAVAAPAPSREYPSLSVEPPVEAAPAAPAAEHVRTGREGLPPITGPSDSASSGATLFERMKSLSRSDKPKAEDDDEDESVFPSIPRFLGRQSNQ